jgi:ribose/xylose/arabinose/galactoside ABC-type transport system permease subunit
MMSLIRRNARVSIAVIALAVLFVAFIAIHPRHLSTYVVSIWANQGILLALAAIAQFFVVLVKGIDLSVGPVVALTNVVASYWLAGSPLEVAIGTAGVLLVGTACGLANGIAVVYGRVQPIVATLATGSMFYGIALTLRPTPGGEVNEGISDALTYDIYGVPTTLIVMVLVVLALAGPLRKTRLGLAMYAIGSSETSAYMTGLRTGTVKLAAYAAGGFFSGAAGFFVAMVTLTGDAGVGPSYTLNSIAAVVLGGVALTGGVGNPLGAVVGALILKTISSLMLFTGLPPLAQPFFEGAILAIAIMLGALNVFRHRSRLQAFE